MGFGKVVEVVPITCFVFKPLGVTFTLCSYCYAMLVGMDWFERIHERCERLLLAKVHLKVATLMHIWVD